MEKLPVIWPWPLGMVDTMFGAEITLLSRMMAKRLPMFSEDVAAAKRRAPTPSKRKPMAGRPFWSLSTEARVSC